MNPFTLTVTVEVQHVEGKFASRDEIAEKLMDELESMDLGGVTADDGGEYEVVSWEVTS